MQLHTKTERDNRRAVDDNSHTVEGSKHNGLALAEFG